MYSLDFILLALKKFYVENKKIKHICKYINIPEKTFYNWRIQFADVLITKKTVKYELEKFRTNKKQTYKSFTEEEIN